MEILYLTDRSTAEKASAIGPDYGFGRATRVAFGRALVGLDPTTWEPTRVKLGGRLLNGLGEEFLHRYGEAGGDDYDTARDTLTFAIYKEVEAGRGSPHGGVSYTGDTAQRYGRSASTAATTPRLVSTTTRPRLAARAPAWTRSATASTAFMNARLPPAVRSRRRLQLRSSQH
jgi:hypothetical protein